MENILIPQEHYPNIEVDVREQDIIQIWQKTDVIQLERAEAHVLLNILKQELDYEN